MSHNAQIALRAATMREFDKPLAAAGLTSYRYMGRYGWIMIGATCDKEALREAARSTRDAIEVDKLQIWNGAKYVHISVN